jgi:predicted  nucleic acid-binding Zn-ribbon protein
LYERIKKKHPAGPVVADATHGRCTACNMMLRPQYFQDLKTAAKLMQCESCGRMLRYAPPIDVVGQMDGGTRVSLS